MKPRLNKSEENRIAAAALLADLEEEYLVADSAPNSNFENQYSKMSLPEKAPQEPLAEREQSVSIASPKALANREQSVSKALAENEVLGLIGKEKRLLFFIYQKCESSGALETPIVTTEELLKNLDVSSVRLRNLIFRLQEQKHLIKVTHVHLGRSGWRRFSVEKDVFQTIRLHLSSEKALAEREQSVSIASPKALAYPLARAPYSSSNDLNNITTNTGGANISAELSMPLNLARFGISQNNLQKLIDEGLCNFEVVQKSVDALSFDVDQGKTGNLASILFGVLRSGKEYVSQKQAEELSKELEFELNRLKDIEGNHQKLLETRLKARYQEFLENTPNHLSEIKKRHHGLLSDNSDLLDKLAFEDFKTQLNQNIENQ